MANIRSIEVIIEEGRYKELVQILEQAGIEEYYSTQLSGNRANVMFLLPAESTEDLIDTLEKKLSNARAFRIIIHPVEATLPRMKEKEDEAGQASRKDNASAIKSPLVRVNREELYADMVAGLDPTVNFTIMMVLSSIVAGIGILKEDVAIIIGAMVIAPLLSPNMALAFATTIGDIQLIRKSLFKGLWGIGLSLIIAVIWGFLDPHIHEINHESTIDYQNVMLAFASGVAGVMAVLRSAPASLVGVMVAVALLPPLVKSGLFLGGGYFNAAFVTFLIFLANIVCINIAGILTFLIAGIRPNRWWEAALARKQQRKALIIWGTMLLILLVIIFYLNYWKSP